MNQQPREVNTEYKRKWRAAHPERVKEIQRRWTTRHRDKYLLTMKVAHYRRKYGITIAQKEEMVAACNSTCPICEKKFKGGYDAHVDHNHSTNKIRGILCGRCNRSLGWFEIHREKLMAYLRYADPHP